MKNFRRLSVLSAILVIFIAGISFLPKSNFSEKKYQAKNVSISIKGTSTLHDWEMKSSEGKCDAIFVLGANNKVTSLSGLSFAVPSKSLKSGNNMMDNNTYKALKTDTHQQIAFTLSSSTLTQLEGFNYQIKCIGKLTIAGATRETELLATGKLNPADNSLFVSGTKKMKMTDYNVKPPTVMMGTIKTGDDITINYNLKLTQ
jgi:polyisoprenoid-binding protein YceI